MPYKSRRKHLAYHAKYRKENKEKIKADKKAAYYTPEAALQRQKRYEALKSQGMCTIHPQTRALPGKTMCKVCADRHKKRYKKSLKLGRCRYHHKVYTPLAPGKTMCQPCLDRNIIRHLPEKCKAEALKKADETREARVNGTYKCPVLGLTEEQLREKFSRYIRGQSIWHFDHIGDQFRNIVCWVVNQSLITLKSEELLLVVDYAKKYEQLRQQID